MPSRFVYLETEYPSSDSTNYEMARNRRGMLLKNTSEEFLTLKLATRSISFEPGEEYMITADEVKDNNMREYLQLRTVVIVRPTTLEEEDELIRSLLEARRLARERVQ